MPISLKGTRCCVSVCAGLHNLHGLQEICLVGSSTINSLEFFYRYWQNVRTAHMAKMPGISRP